MALYLRRNIVQVIIGHLMAWQGLSRLWGLRLPMSTAATVLACADATGGFDYVLTRSNSLQEPRSWGLIQPEHLWKSTYNVARGGKTTKTIV